MWQLFVVTFFDWWEIQFDQVWSSLIHFGRIWSKKIKNKTTRILCRYAKSCHIYKKDKNGRSVFDFFGSDLSKMDQTWSKWIFHKSKSVSIKSFHIYKKNKNGCFIFDFFGSDLSKMDQTWSNWISHQSKNVTIKSCHI